MRLLFWSTALVCTGVAVALILWAVLGDAAGAERASAVVGAVVGLAGLVASVFALRPGSGAAVRAGGRGAVAAGGSVIGNAIGADSRVTGVALAPRAAPGPERTVSAQGEGAVAAGGDVTGNALGEGTEVTG
ncbi:hypothetical protein OG401_01330 [Kitasatospora purpeofusca]|uniref:hypothetical protein n=1 Tax=Kitasatospora purpeofusca TaxID=67352 RepID=UPI002256EE17|nr:hypothetical protein [Kitasatospora purpeofusca]MCX4682961.1 hypothetical protein [Kitasatospora purpeofusca]